MNKSNEPFSNYFKKTCFKLPNLFKCTLIIILTVVCLSFVSAQESKVWDYPIHSGTPEWEMLKSFKEKLSVYNIPDSLLHVMNTEDLILTCLAYPEWILMTSRDSNQKGFDYLKTIFNGFRELEKRADAGPGLIKIYKEMRPDAVNKFKTLTNQGGFIFKFAIIETLISQKSFLSKLNRIDLAELLYSSINIYKQKVRLEKEYSLHSCASTCLILGRILELFYPVQFKLMEPLGIIKFVEAGTLSDKDLLNQIVINSETYLNNIMP